MLALYLLKDSAYGISEISDQAVATCNPAVILQQEYKIGQRLQGL